MRVLRSDEAPLETELSVRWLGTAGFEITSPGATVLIDPYLTRSGLWRLMTRPAVSDCRDVLRRFQRVDAILIGHSHFDHLLDAPAIARELGAVLYGSPDTLRVGRAEGLSDELLRPMAGGDRLEVGDLVVEVIQSVHSNLVTQRLVGGDMPAHVHVPMGFLDYKCGPVMGFLIHWRGRTVYHGGSAQLIDQNLAGRNADVLLQCMSGWKTDPTVFARMKQALDPRVLVPMHHDDFFRPFDRGLRVGPLAYQDEAVELLRRDMPRASILGLDFFEALAIGGQDE